MKGVIELICEKRYKIRKTIDNPTARLILYIAAKKINEIRIKFPKPVSNKLTNKFGIAIMLFWCDKYWCVAGNSKNDFATDNSFFDKGVNLNESEVLVFWNAPSFLKTEIKKPSPFILSG